jgi:hypothetical protein
VNGERPTQGEARSRRRAWSKNPNPSTAAKTALDELTRAIDAAAVRGQTGRWGMRLKEGEFDPELAPVVPAFNATLTALRVVTAGPTCGGA